MRFYRWVPFEKIHNALSDLCFSWWFQIPPATVSAHGCSAQLVLVNRFGDLLDHTCGIRMSITLSDHSPILTSFQHQYLESRLEPGTEVKILLDLSRGSSIILILM